MGKFSDTTYVRTVDNLLSAQKDKLNNPYYIFSEQKPTKVNYYPINIEKSTLDESSQINEDFIGTNSPLVYNKIKDFLIYGIEQIQINYDIGDYGMEADGVSDDAFILPNTITPRPGDLFSVPYLKESILFRVNAVSIDTLDNGSNIYKIEYSLKYTSKEILDRVDSEVEKTYNFVVGNVGTDFKAVIQDCDYDFVLKLEDVIERLTIHFNNIFFNTRLQTFVFNHDGWRMYDPFMIEFFIRNKVLNYGDNYMHVSHAASLNKTFSMDYSKTFFNYLENTDMNNFKINTLATADLITDINSLFATRAEDYYIINYNDNTPYKTKFFTIDPEVIENIKNNKYFDNGDAKEFYNIWVAYFNNDKDFIASKYIDLILKTDYMDNLNYFYGLGITIFILEKYINILLT